MTRNNKTSRRTVSIDSKLWQEIMDLAGGEKAKVGKILDEAVYSYLAREQEQTKDGTSPSSAPYGFHSADGELVKNRGEYGIVMRIMQLKAKGRTADQIALRLNDSRIRTRNKEKWQAQTVESALQSYREQIKKNVSELNRGRVDR